MGLKEKQAMANVDFGWAEKQIEENVGKKIKIEMDANSFSNDMDAVLYADQRGGVVAANALASVCRNDIGKDAFNEKNVTKVLLKNQQPGSRSVTFEGTNLVIACAFANNDDYYSDAEVRDAIENQL